MSGVLRIPKGPDHVCRVHMDDADGARILAKGLWASVAPGLREKRAGQRSAELVILCVGTDRSTGDCLGPMVGTQLLATTALPAGVHLYGTLDEPVHAGNLNEYARIMQRDYRHTYVLALDACLGKCENIGYITVKQGPLKPGTGVHKNLGAVGTAHMVGVVNVGGFMEYFVLQNTRLNLVLRMAQMMATALAGMLAYYRNARAAGSGKTEANDLPYPAIIHSWLAAPVAPSSIDGMPGKEGSP